MRFKTRHTILLLLPAFLFASCTDYDIKGWQMTPDELTDTSIISFVVKASDEGANYSFDAFLSEDSIKIRIPYSFDPKILEKAKVTVDLPNMATFYPVPYEEADYSKERIVTVTAADKVTTKDYVFAWVPHGFGNAYESWFKTWDELGLGTDQGPCSGAVCGDYLVISRAHTVYNRFTGEKMDFELNLGDSPAQIFWLTNDDAGNLVGGTLGAITPDSRYIIYAWTDPRENPVKIFETVDAQAGRKLDVRGNVFETAYLSTQRYTGPWSDEMVYRRIKVENGTVSELPDITTGRVKANGYPAVTLHDAADSTRYYVFGGYDSGSGQYNICIQYGSTGTQKADGLLLGPLQEGIAGHSGYYGWGNLQKANVQVFEVNGVDYLFMVNAYGTDASPSYYLVVEETERAKNWTNVRTQSTYYVSDIITDGGANGNGTSSVTVVENPEEQRAYVYVLATNAGVACHILETSRDE